MTNCFLRYEFESTAEMVRAAAQQIAAVAAQTVAQRGKCAIALAGGRTPRPVYRLLATPPLVENVPWAQTQLYFGDERHVPPDHPDSNYRMANEELISLAPVPPENVFPIQTSASDPAQCAADYEKLLRQNLPQSADGFPVFDLILLGLGEDGHTASLFPETAAAAERTRWLAASRPTDPRSRPDCDRITITAPVIWNATHVLVMTTGEAKAGVLRALFAPDPPANPPVARLLRECRSEVTFFIAGLQAVGI